MGIVNFKDFIYLKLIPKGIGTGYLGLLFTIGFIKNGYI